MIRATPGEFATHPPGDPAQEGLHSCILQVVAISEGVVEMMVHDVLMPFYASHPGIHVELTTDSVNSIVDKVRTDAVHLGVRFNPPEHNKVSVLKRRSSLSGWCFAQIRR